MKKKNYWRNKQTHENWAGFIFLIVVIVWSNMPYDSRDYSLPEKWETFGSINGWKINYPEDWGRRFYGYGGVKDHFNLLAKFWGDDATVNVYFREIEDTSAEAIENLSLEVLDERGADLLSDLIVEDHEKYVSYSRISDRCSYRSECKYVFLITEDGVYIIEYAVHFTRFDKMLPLFDVILDSFYVNED